MRTGIRRLIIVLAVVGLGASALSTYVHYQLVQNPGYLSFCDVSESVSCTEVYLSRFGSVRGVPVALAGVFWFGVVLLLATAGGRATSEFREALPTYVSVLSTLGLATVSYLAYASFFILGTVCVLCVAVYVAVLGIFLLSGSGQGVPISSLPGHVWRDLPGLLRRRVALASALVLLAAVGGAAAWFVRAEAVEPVTERATPARPIAADQSEFQRWWEAQPRIELSIPDAAAKVLVVKFNDYQCPACAQTYFGYERVFAKYEASHPGEVKLVTLDYPLDPECNPQTPNGPHQAACEAAVGVRLAERNGQRERMERWLFTNQEGLSPERVQTAAREVAGVATFEADYQRVLQDVKADIALGETVGVDGTPTFVVNGVTVKGGLAPEFFDAAIAYELKRAGGT